MQYSERGAGLAKPVIVLAFLGALAYVTVKTVPVYVRNYELKDYIRQLAIQATVNRVRADRVRDQVVAYARDLDLPLSPDNVKVEAGSKVTISIDYTVPIDLKVYTWVLHFTLWEENRAL